MAVYAWHLRFRASEPPCAQPAEPLQLGSRVRDPTSSGIVLWTRLAPDPADLGALGRQDLTVGWRIARDDGMRRVIARGRARAQADMAHSVHVEVDGRAPVPTTSTSSTSPARRARSGTSALRQAAARRRGHCSSPTTTPGWRPSSACHHPSSPPAAYQAWYEHIPVRSAFGGGERARANDRDDDGSDDRDDDDRDDGRQ